MSLSSAKAKLDAQGGDPVTGYISKTDHKESYDELLDDTALTGATTAEAITVSGAAVAGTLNGRDPDDLAKGPASATDNALVRFDGTTGKVVQNSGITVDDSNNVSGVGTIGSGAVTSSGAVQAAAASGFVVGSSGPRVMSGTGSPEGVVTAPVGSRWIRTDGATLGDFEYQKRSGTGNTGWVVSDGDTGWRLLDATAFAVDTGKFTLTECKLRRAGATVHLHMAGTKVGTTGGAIATVPSGFRVADADALYQPVFNFTAKTFPAAGNVQANGNVYWDGSLANAAVYTFTAVWLTADAWPSSLPGSAA